MHPAPADSRRLSAAAPQQQVLRNRVVNTTDASLSDICPDNQKLRGDAVTRITDSLQQVKDLGPFQPSDRPLTVTAPASPLDKAEAVPDTMEEGLTMMINGKARRIIRGWVHDGVHHEAIWVGEGAPFGCPPAPMHYRCLDGYHDQPSSPE